MTNIEFLRAYQSADPIIQLALNQKLITDLAKLTNPIETGDVEFSNGMYLFLWLVRSMAGLVGTDQLAPITAANLINTAQKLNLNLTEELTSWAREHGTTSWAEILADVGHSKIEIPDMTLLPRTRIWEIYLDLKDNYPDVLYPDPVKNNIWSGDDWYFVPSLDQLKDIARKLPSKNYPYLSETRDCDDFVAIAQGWLSEQGYGSLAIFNCSVECLDSNNNLQLAHAWLFAVYAENSGIKYTFIEPQAGSFIPLGEPGAFIYQGIKRTVIYALRKH